MQIHFPRIMYDVSKRHMTYDVSKRRCVSSKTSRKHFCEFDAVSIQREAPLQLTPQGMSGEELNAREAATGDAPHLEEEVPPKESNQLAETEMSGQTLRTTEATTSDATLSVEAVKLIDLHVPPETAPLPTQEMSEEKSKEGEAGTTPTNGDTGSVGEGDLNPSNLRGETDQEQSSGADCEASHLDSALSHDPVTHDAEADSQKKESVSLQQDESEVAEVQNEPNRNSPLQRASARKDLQGVESEVATDNQSSAIQGASDSSYEEGNAEFRKWLENLGLGQYFQKFFDEGYDDLEYVENIEEDDFDRMGVLRGHRRKILGRLRSQIPRSPQQGNGDDAVRKWLEKEKFGRYCKAFLKEGFDDMESFSQVQESDLKFMNVKTGHMRAILIRLNPNPAPKVEVHSLPAYGLHAQNTYQQKTKEELSFNKGDLVVVLEEFPNGRCRGSVNGKEGYFPKTALQRASVAGDDDCSHDNARDKDKSLALSEPKTMEEHKVSGTSLDDPRQVIGEAKADHTAPGTKAAQLLALQSSENKTNKLETNSAKTEEQVQVPVSGQMSGVAESASPQDNQKVGFSSEEKKDVAGGIQAQEAEEASRQRENFKKDSDEHETAQTISPSREVHSTSSAETVHSRATQPTINAQAGTEGVKPHNDSPTPSSTAAVSDEAKSSALRSGSSFGNTNKGADVAIYEPSITNQESRHSDAEKQQDKEIYYDCQSDTAADRHAAKARNNGSVANPAVSQVTDARSGADRTQTLTSAPLDNGNTRVLEARERANTRRGVKVIFHALLHPEWEFDTTNVHHKVCIRFGARVYVDWNWNVVDMQFVGEENTDGGKLLKLSGMFYIEKELQAVRVPYKYLVYRNGSPEWEFLFRGSQGVINRVLNLPEFLRTAEEGLFHKFDDVVRKEPGIFQKGWAYFAGSTARSDSQELAIRATVPRWKGFFPKSSGENFNMPAVEAVEQFQNVVSSLSNLPYEQRRGLTEFCVLPPLRLKRIIADILTPKLVELGRRDFIMSEEEAEDALLSALSISLLINHYDLEVKQDQLLYGDYHALLRNFKLMYDGHQCRSYDSLLANFQDRASLFAAVYKIFRVVCSPRQPPPPPVWIVAIPLIHFLRETSLPFEFPTSLRPKMPEWWSHSGIEKELEHLRKHYKAKSLLPFKKDIVAMKALDPVVARPALFVVKFSELKEFEDLLHPCDFILAVVKRWDSAPPEKNELVSVVNKELVSSLAAKVALTSLDTNPASTTQAIVRSGIYGSSQLLLKICSKFKERKSTELIRSLIDLVFSYVSLLNEVPESYSDQATASRFYVTSVDDVLKRTALDVFRWLRDSSPRSQSADALRQDVEVWDGLFDTGFLNGDLQARWNNLLEKEFSDELGKSNGERILKTYSLMGDSKFHPIIDRCFMKMSESALEKLISSKENQDAAFVALMTAAKSRTRKPGHHRRLLEILLTKNAPDDAASKSEWRKGLLTWPLWHKFLRFSGELFSGKESGGNVGRILARAEQVLVEFVEELASASVTVCDYKLAENGMERLLGMCSVVDGRRNNSELKQVAISALTQRRLEYKAFDEERSSVLSFANSCRLLGNVDLDDLSASAIMDVSDNAMRSLAVTDGASIRVTFFSLPNDVREYLIPLDKVQNSDVFRKLWTERGEEAKIERERNGQPVTQPFSLEELVEKIIRPVFEIWERVCRSLHEASITLKDVGKLFSNILGKEEDLCHELMVMDPAPTLSKTWVPERVKQILQLARLNKSSSAATAVLHVCDVLKIERFPAVEKMQEQNSAEFLNQPLSVMTDDLVLASRFLTDMKEEEIACLEQFAKCDHLVAWVREELEEWKELETFVELAGTRSSAEGDYEAIKVAHLRAACSGFSSLLFDIRADILLDQFQVACKAVFNKLERDKDIPKKWSDTAKDLRDFKIMKESLGSVEISSFSEVEVINSMGQYVLGCRSKETPQSVSDCISLLIRETEPAVSLKKYYLSDLQDLQSKLILISGYKDERRNEVNVFVDTLEHVTRLAFNFVALCRAGHVKYLNWKKSFDCVSPLNRPNDPGDENNVQLKQVEELCQEMRHVALEMETDLKKWKEDLANTRMTYYYLNYFTMAQLLILGRELGHLAHDGSYGLPNKVYGLLECIKPNIASNDVTLSLEEACVRQESAHENDSTSGFEQMSFAFGSSSFVDDHTSDFSFEMPDSSFSTMDINSSVFDAEPSLPEHELAADVATFNPENDEYLSLETLGEFLEILARSAPRLPSRSFQGDFLRLGAPNLFIVPEVELIQTVMSLYMEDDDSPLPSAEEVLLCSSTTTVEDICLFWRRAIKDPSQSRLFCLAGADRLTYEVSRDAVEELYQLGQGLYGQRGEQYRLVVVCCSENEDRSYIVSALEQYKQHALPCPTPGKVQAYLKRKFRDGPARQKLRTATNVDWTPAASVLDHEKCCVRVVFSTRAGVGKTLFIDQMASKLYDISNNKQARRLQYGRKDPLTRVTVPLHDLVVDTDVMLETLDPAFPSPKQALSRLIHIDISPSVRQKGLENLLFNLLVLGQIMDSKGNVWRRRLTDMYVLECTWSQEQAALVEESSTTSAKETNRHVPFVCFLPYVSRGSPEAALDILKKEKNPRIEDPSLDVREFGNSNFQRTFQYLTRYLSGQSLEKFKFVVGSMEGTPPVCLETLLRSCGVQNPSWAILKHFVNFLSNQLLDCESSDFCSQEASGEDLPGFKSFVMKLMIRMSKDFSTPSLNIDLGTSQHAGSLSHYLLRRKWEQDPHPYLFFNEDRQSMTFVGLRITRRGQLVHMRTREILDEQIMTRELSAALHTQGFRLQQDYEQWSKEEKIAALCNVMGLNFCPDPDPTYELTVDNVIKILAIHMRLRCGIPVVVMGETGCGKTRLIRYMCRLQCKSQEATNIKNLFLMKVHGGVTRKDIMLKVHEAEVKAEANYRLHQVKTVLFFDEANTTDAVGLIKEIMCDKRVNGHKIRGLGHDLHVIAACNPYRKHTEVMIEKLEAAGLGYHVRTGDTEDRLGQIPLRQLVYRVHPLPDSVKALVWDFGQLKPDAEKAYISQIVSRYVLVQKSLPRIESMIDVVTNVLAASQNYMRSRNDECSFVSLRDVERAMMVMAWFYTLDEALEPYIEKAYSKAEKTLPIEQQISPLDTLTRSLVLSLGVCYQARLQEREQFREEVCKFFSPPCALKGGSAQMRREIEYCQSAFLDELELPPKIGKNHALKENVFMMVVCINLRIPLFLVGKPGSSKSLAKDVVKNAMRGDLSSTDLFRRLKQVHMVSYQCSQLSTAGGIISTFSQCQRMQKENDLDKFVACVVLDEVGLAEDSPRLPLKALHPLLDDGTAGADDSEEDLPSNRVAFVGISNWALDPAKMNRGILVQREVPSDQELIVSALGICSTDGRTKRHLEPYIAGMASAYLEICQEAKKKKEREFFGLRDFYSLVKMMFSFCKMTEQPPTWDQMFHAIKRNFGGLDGIDSVEIFHKHLVNLSSAGGHDFAPDCSSAGLIKASLKKDTDFVDTEESRYLLLLTENYAALNIVRQRFLVGEDPVIIFGSSFSKDQEYTQICRTINRVKVCMATGRTVVLLNLEQLYESLYDALNQYYVYHGGQRFVDLGLGSHRVKCQVHKNFRLILIADRDVVYKDYPIPLINRMEKHFLAMSSILTGQQQRMVDNICLWVKQFAEVDWREQGKGRQKSRFKPGDAFMGYHKDAVATVILRACHRIAEEDGRSELDSGTGDENWEKTVIDDACCSLLRCATPDAVARLPASSLHNQADALWDVYFERQEHSNLASYLKHQFQRERSSLLVQITTHSRLLSTENIRDVEARVGLRTESISLQQFDTEQQFCSRVGDFYSRPDDLDAILIILCEAGDINGDLVACARYLVQEEQENAIRRRSFSNKLVVNRHVVVVVHLPRIAGGSFLGFQGGAWTEVHIDDLPVSHATQPPITSLVGRKISSLFGDPRESEIQLNDSESENLPTNSSVGCVLSAAPVLRECIHGSVSRLDHLDDESSSAESANERISLLFSLIPEDETSAPTHVIRFFNELKRRVVRLLKEKEGRGSEDSALEWVKIEARSQDSIQAGGTFRQSLWLKIVRVITPVFAEMIAFMDANSNLFLLRNAKATTVPNWVSILWIDIFSCRGLLSLNYEDCLSPGENAQARPRVLVKNHGFQEQPFVAQFPFSGNLKMEIDIMLEKTKERTGLETKNLLNAMQHVFDESPLGSLIRDVDLSFPEARDELVTAYLADFVYMVYPCACHGEVHSLVVAAIVNGFKELRAASYGKDILTAEETLSTKVLTIPAVHVAHDYIRIRLKHFSELSRIDASVLSFLSRQKGKDNSQEMNLDSAAFKLFLERLYPSSTDLLLQGTRNKWMQRVQEAKPILDAWLALPILDDLPERSDNFQRARVMWTKICTVRLYFVHAKPLAESEFVAKTGCTLWKNIENETPDFRTAETINLLLHFLHDASKDCFSKMFQSSKQCLCCKKLWKNPVQLLCEHIFCLLCLTNMSSNGTNFPCPDCGTLVQNQEFQISVDLKKKIDSFLTFKRCCTSFFMELVSAYTFNAQAQKAPASDVVRLLMTLITRGTIELGEETPKDKEFLLFVDSTPVVRSFLLQLLLRYSQDETKGLVHNYLQETQKVIECHADGAEYIMDLRVIFVQCVEDSLDCASSGNPQHLLFLVSRELTKVLENLHAEQHSLAYLQSVASTRFSLRVVAEWILQQLRKPRGSPLPRERIAVFRMVEKLLSDQNDPHRLLFLLKQLVRKSGTDVLSKLSHIHQFLWLENAIRHYTDENEAVEFDYCASIGNSYKLVREGVARSVFTASSAPLSDSVESLPHDVKGHAKTAFILLSIYREVTMREASEDVSRHVGKEVRNVLREFCRTLPCWAENVGNQLIDNSLGGTRAPKAVVVAPSQPSRIRSAAAVALHVLLAIETADNLLMKPLIYMMKNPEMLRSSFFPTMPDDNFLAVKGAARGDKGTKWHMCPNGHPYFIDNCGRAVEKGLCHCGARIGAASFLELAEGNVPGERVDDATEKGHVLGEADARPDLVAPERDLSSPSCAIIRLLMHAALMWASCNADQDSLESFAQIVRPAVPDGDLPSFFWKHFEKDIVAFAQAIGQTSDDGCAVIHQILNGIVLYRRDEQFESTCLLQTKEDRQMWEKTFNVTYIEPLLLTMGKTMGEWMTLVTKDDRVGNCPLLRWLYEVESPPGSTSPPSLWRYRAQVTVAHLKVTLNQQYSGRPEAQPKILKEFLKEERNIRYLRHLPKILRLQRLLLDKYHHRLSLQEAKALTLGNFLKKLPDHEQREFKDLLQVFSSVWHYLCPEIFEHGRLKPKKAEDKMPRVISLETSVSFLLPTTKGPGTCSMSLVDYLINCVHNEFVARFRSLSGMSGLGPKIPMREITSTQLISYDLEKNLIPLVLSHCNYSLEVGKGCDISYDFAGIERQLVDRFLTGKPQIQFEAREFSFSGDLYTTALFVKIRHKVPQANLAPAVSRQIASELPNLTDIYSVLSVLDVLLGFIVSTGGDKEKLIHDYLHSTLRMPEDQGLVSPKARQHCRLKHVLSLWRIAAVEKGKRLALNYQDPFEDLPAVYKDGMDNELKQELEKYLRTINVNLFMSEIMELALLQVRNKSEVKGFEDYVIKDALDELCQSELEGSERCPEALLLRHLLHCWSTAVHLQDSLDRC
ncbi:E3 ubiquitin-protein ligase rnf213-alpha-like isoform X2 [Oscarella lobularis]|uniref:E3 ubiquitin-protein ligase rnf213-alpha-like isoform X2 n=1 Tax=Oscarella lobularis TaxID=121494 RepID=UPI0033143F39